MPRGRAIATYERSKRRAIDYPSGKHVFGQGDPCESVFYIREGRVKISVLSPTGREAVVGILGAGDFFVALRGTRYDAHHFVAEAFEKGANGAIVELFTDPATVLPVQIFLWSDLPEPAFQQKTAAAIVVLLVFLFVMNGMAIWLRKRFERRW